MTSVPQTSAVSVIKKCYWRGGPLDLYRQACLTSHAVHGHYLELHSGAFHSQTGAAIEPQSPQASSSILLERGRLYPWILSSSQLSEWIDPDIFRLHAEQSRFSNLKEWLVWIEAFKLWLPDYCDEIRRRSSQHAILPLHLSFAEMASIDLHSLPPQGSFLDELLCSQEAFRDPMPLPRHDNNHVRLKILEFFLREPTWSREMLAKHCDPTVLTYFGLYSKPNKLSLLKRVFRKILN